MRFMVIVKATKDSEAGNMPSEEMLGAMAKFNEEMVKAGIMLDGADLRGRPGMGAPQRVEARPDARVAGLHGAAALRGTPAIGRRVQHGEHREGNRRQDEVSRLELDHVTLLSLS